MERSPFFKRAGRHREETIHSRRELPRYMLSTKGRKINVCYGCQRFIGNKFTKESQSIAIYTMFDNPGKSDRLRTSRTYELSIAKEIVCGFWRVIECRCPFPLLIHRLERPYLRLSVQKSVGRADKSLS